MLIWMEYNYRVILSIRLKMLWILRVFINGFSIVCLFFLLFVTGIYILPMLNPTLYSENRRCPSMVYIPFHSIRSHHIIRHLTSTFSSKHHQHMRRLMLELECIQTKYPTIDRDNNLKEGTGLRKRRSPRLVSEKSSHGSPGHGTGTGTDGSTLHSPETRNSRDRSLAENSLLAPWLSDGWPLDYKVQVVSIDTQFSFSY